MTELRVAVRNDGVSLRRIPWLSGVLRDSEPDLHVELVTVDPGTPRDGKPALVGRSDIAVSNLWESLRNESADVAWFDLRYAPPELPEDVEIIGWAPRLNPRMALIHRENRLLRELPDGTRLSTTDALALAQMRNSYKQVKWADLDGDLPTRLHKVHLRQADGIIAAASDLLSLGFSEQVIDFVPLETAIPAAAQGIWALCRLRNAEPVELPETLNDARSRTHGEVERLFMSALTPADDMPVGVLARSQRGKLLLAVSTTPTPGKDPIHLSISGPPNQHEELIQALVTMLLQRGVSVAKSSRKK